jgi:hypothetical protein
LWNVPQGSWSFGLLEMPVMSTQQNLDLPLMRFVAYSLVTTGSWLLTAEKAQRPVEELEKMTSQAPEEWRLCLAEAQELMLEESFGEAMVTLRRATRSNNERVRVQAANTLVRVWTAQHPKPRGKTVTDTGEPPPKPIVEPSATSPESVTRPSVPTNTASQPKASNTVGRIITTACLLLALLCGVWALCCNLVKGNFNQTSTVATKVGFCDVNNEGVLLASNVGEQRNALPTESDIQWRGGFCLNRSPPADQ